MNDYCYLVLKDHLSLRWLFFENVKIEICDRRKSVVGLLSFCLGPTAKSQAPIIWYKSKQGHVVDALALRGDERRGSLR